MNGMYPIAGVMEFVDCEPPGDIQVMIPYWIYRRICDLLVAVQPGKGWAFAREQPRNSAGVAHMSQYRVGDFGVREPREPLYTAASQTPLMDLFGLGTG